MLFDPKWEVPTKTTPSEPWRELLLKAANLIEMRGHAKRALEDSRGRLCILGAINMADFGAAESGSRAFSDHHLVACARLGYRAAHVIHWNDAPERTKAEVVEHPRKIARP